MRRFNSSYLDERLAVERRRHAFLRLEVLAEEGAVREVQFVGDLLDGALRVAKPMLYLLDGSLLYPCVGSLPAELLYHGREVLGRDAQLGSIERHASFLHVVLASKRKKRAHKYSLFGL